MTKETPENLGEFNLVVPAKDLLDAVVESADALSTKPMTEDRLKSMKLVLGFLNAYREAFRTKVGYFKLVGLPEKIKAVKDSK